MLVPHMAWHACFITLVRLHLPFLSFRVAFLVYPWEFSMRYLGIGCYIIEANVTCMCWDEARSD